MLPLNRWASRRRGLPELVYLGATGWTRLAAALACAIGPAPRATPENAWGDAGERVRRLEAGGAYSSGTAAGAEQYGTAVIYPLARGDVRGVAQGKEFHA